MKIKWNHILGLGSLLLLSACTAQVEPPTSAPVMPTAVATAVTLPTEPATAMPSPTPSVSIPDLQAQIVASLSVGLAPTPTPDASGYPGFGDFSIGTLPLATNDGSVMIAAYSQGMRAYDPLQNHFIALYQYKEDVLSEIVRLEMVNPDFIAPDQWRQVTVDKSPSDGRLWLELNSGIGAHSACYDLVLFDGTALSDQITNCGVSQAAMYGGVTDLNGDGRSDLLLNYSNEYVFCYACGVQAIVYQPLTWDGTAWVNVNLTELPESAPAELRDPNNQAVRLANAGLWPSAQALIAPLPADDPTVHWNQVIIAQYVAGYENFLSYTHNNVMQEILYGDYSHVLDSFRAYTPQQIFDPAGPMVVGTPAESFVGDLTSQTNAATTLALEVQPDLASAYFLRGWANFLSDPTNPTIVPDLQKAADLAPDDAMIQQCLLYVRGE